MTSFKRTRYDDWDREGKCLAVQYIYHNLPMPMHVCEGEGHMVEVTSTAGSLQPPSYNHVELSSHLFSCTHRLAAVLSNASLIRT